MADATVDIGTGVVITFASSGFTSELIDLGLGPFDRPSIDTSHMATAAAGVDEIGNATAIPGDIVNPGELTMELHFDPSQNPPIDYAAEIVTITWGSGSTWVSSGFFTSFTFTAPLEDKMTATAVFKLSGPTTMTDAT